ncbi:MAG: DUF1648 domain-containing protein [Bacteroidota bacterium]
MSQPSITIPRTQFDNFLIGLGILGLLIMGLLIVVYQQQLPDTIPTHFDATGQPDATGNKSNIYFLVGIGAFVVIMIYLINRTPHLANYSVPITKENAPRQYHNFQQMNRAVAAIIALCLAFIHYAIIQMSLGQRDGLGLWFVLLFLTLIFGTIGYFLYRAHAIK